MIYIDLYWFILIYIDLYWFILRFGCKSWVLMILTSKRVWQLLRHFEALRSNAHRIIWRKKNKGHSCSTRMIIIWLVVSLPLCKMMEFVSWDYDIPKMMGKIKVKVDLSQLVQKVLSKQSAIYWCQYGSHSSPWVKLNIFHSQSKPSLPISSVVSYGNCSLQWSSHQATQKTAISPKFSF